MSRLDIDIQEALKHIKGIEDNNKDLLDNYNKIINSFETLGNSWRDNEYNNAKNYFESAGQVINRYSEQSLEYTEVVGQKIKLLEQNYTESGGSELGDLGNLELGNLELDDVNTEKDTGEIILKIIQNEKGKFGVEINGELAIPDIYDNIHIYEEINLIKVEVGNKLGFFDKEGEELIAVK